eukprot:scaffold1115_cov390-Prasinococcus_capsulatus_cf.AAC.7
MNSLRTPSLVVARGPGTRAVARSRHHTGRNSGRSSIRSRSPKLWRSSSSADLQGRSWSSQRNACLCWAASSAESTANVSLGTSNGRPCSSTRDVQQLWEVAFFRSEKINANPCRKYSPVPETGLARFESLTCSCQDKVYNTNFIMSYCVLHRARILSQKLQSGSALASAWIVLLMPVFLLSTAIEGKVSGPVVVLECVVVTPTLTNRSAGTHQCT